MPNDRPAGSVSFQAHVELLEVFLTHRDEIVEKIAKLLNARNRPGQHLRDVSELSLHFKDCFFRLDEVTRDQSRLRDQLEEAHWERGFRPRYSPALENDLVDPAEMMVRAFHLWERTHWPGRNGRDRYAQTLFNLYVIRRLALLVMRVWDAGPAEAAERLARVQGVLDRLWRGTPADQPVLLRDARWLIPVAQSPTTDELAGYFEVAEQVAETLPPEDRIAVQSAGVRMGGGHLRSQLRHVSVQKGVSIDEKRLVLSTRQSNALDFALLVQGLVPLLGAYERAVAGGDVQSRLELADAICQGISPDPELFLGRRDLLGPYSMIEHLFVTTDGDGRAVHSPTGRRHLLLLEAYEERIRRVAGFLHEDFRHFRPVRGAYSPYGVLYGFSSNLIELMALETLRRDAITRFSLEDVFVGGNADRLEWVNRWRKLPHVTPEVLELFEYPQQFAEEVFRRIEDALGRCVSDGGAEAGARTGRLFVRPEDGPETDPEMAGIPELSARYIRSSDMRMVTRGKAEFLEQRKLLHSRLEGEFVVSYQSSSGWIGISKDILSEVLGAGRDARLVGLPREAVEVLQLMCPDHVVLRGTSPP